MGDATNSPSPVASDVEADAEVDRVLFPLLHVRPSGRYVYYAIENEG